MGTEQARLRPPAPARVWPRAGSELCCLGALLCKQTEAEIVQAAQQRMTWWEVERLAPFPVHHKCLITVNVTPVHLSAPPPKPT